jgi:tetratricopeptide (TPR) repeat protein
MSAQVPGFPMISRAILAAAFLLPAFVQAQDNADLRAMEDELARTMSQVQLQGMDKPYFAAYRMDDIRMSTISALLGSLTQDSPTRMRFVGVEIRVGDPSLDNTNFFSTRIFGAGAAGLLGGIRQAPLDDDYQQIRRAFWLATDTQYKKALEDLSSKRAALAAQNQAAKLPDFSSEPSKVEYELLSAAALPDEDLKKLARDLSAVFKSSPDLYASSVDIQARGDDARYVNSEGSAFTRSQRIIKLEIKAPVQAADGLSVADSIDLYGRTLADLPSEDTLIARARSMGGRILKLRSAASLDRYNGPVLFEGEAAPELFAQQFVTGLSAVRTPLSDQVGFVQFFDQIMNPLGGRSFEDKIGGRVLPDFLSVTDNPRIAEYQGLKLMGACTIDDDAVATQETKLVEHGLLKMLLSTRVPTSATSHSTGSRRGWGSAPSNLLVTTDRPTTDAELRKQLLRLAADRGLPFAIVVRHIGGGSAASFIKMAARMMQQDVQVGGSLAEVYKLFPDGHEELVRGVELSDMNPALFRDIVAAGDTPTVYTDDFIPRVTAIFSSGVSAATQVPVVSYVAPSLLFDEVSLAHSEGQNPSLPVGTSPVANGPTAVTAIKPASDPAAAKLIAAGRQSIQHHEFEAAQSQLDEARSLNPEQAYLWVNYGYLEFQRGNMSAAIPDYRKELALYPNNYGTYSSLAEAQNILGQEKEVQETLRNWAAAQPDSPAPVTALVSMLLDENHATEAVAAAEAGIARLPEISKGDQRLQLLTGRAQLAAGMKQNGEATLLALIHITTDPGMMNNAAYELAKAGLDLDLSESTAKAALAKFTEESKTWTLHENSQNTLAKSRLIAASWDTVGWILYRQGKLAEAENYIQSAWVNRQDAEIGEHLAEIAEAKGNPDQALRLWELALATYPNFQRPSVRKTPGATQKELIEHIEALRKAGVKEPAEDADEALLQLRTVSLGASGGLIGTAEYRLLLSNGEILDLQKISDKEVPEARERIKGAKLPSLWPKGSEAQLVRNAILNCHTGICELVLEP